MSKKRVRHHVNPLADQTEVAFDGFGNDLPIMIDIGADRGEFTEGLIEEFGDTRNFIVCEIRKPLAERLRVKFAENENVVVFDGDAGRNLKNIIVPCIEQGAKIEEIYINFPDPWFKDRHKKRRFLNERLLESIKEWFPSEAVWIFQTDQKVMFDETEEMLTEEGIKNIKSFDTPPYGITTKWEDAKVEAGYDIHRMKFNLTK